MNACAIRSMVMDMRIGGAAFIAVLCIAFGVAAPDVASAASGPQWNVETVAPTYFVPGRGGAFEAIALNTGTGGAGEVTVIEKLPAGFELARVGTGSKEAPSVELFWTRLSLAKKLEYDRLTSAGLCNTTANGLEVRCTIPKTLTASEGDLEPGESVRLVANTRVLKAAAEGPVDSEAIAEGAGVGAVVAHAHSTISSQPRFGVSVSMHTTETVPGPVTNRHWGVVHEPVAFTQAGGHPDALTTTVEFATEDYATPENYVPTPVQDPKDVSVALPAGLLGNPTALPRCPLEDALSHADHPCPAASQVGTFAYYLFGGHGVAGAIYNVTPEAGQSAEFVLASASKFNVKLTAHVVRTPEGYGLTVDSNGINQVQLYKVETTFWGVPASPVHDRERGLLCEKDDLGFTWGCPGVGNEPGGGTEVSFLTWPADCTAAPEQAFVKSDSWQEPVQYVNGQLVSGRYATAQTGIPGVTGCDLLSFAPGIGVEPDTTLADAPVGVGVNVVVPQFEEALRLGTPELRSAVITLPLGMSVSPGIVDGIQACNESGPEGINFTGPESEEVGLNGELQLAPGHCPDASIVGTAEAVTPLLSEPIKGHIYLARPGCGNAALGQAPCTEQDALDGNLYKLYMELGGTGPLANTGVNIKIPGETEADPATGQLTTRFEGFKVGDPPHFEGNPQLPFSELKVHLNGGPRAPIDNPPACGVARTTSDLKPWSAPGVNPEGVFVSGLPDANPSSYFEVQGCSSPPGLAPGFVAGTVTPNAGKFSAFTMNISRKDREQYVKGIQVHTPPGLLAMLSSVPLCPEIQANDPAVYGECAASKIGTTRVASGAGSHPFEIEGSIYLTGPHNGAPFGLSIVTHAVAGPFDLGVIVVRARIDIDPTDSTATITTDETGPYALPQIVFGVPLRLQRVTVKVDRPGFMFNPTNCKAQQVTAAVSGNQEAVANVSSPFAVGNCTSLKFEPRFQVSTNGHTSRRAGASLYAKLSYPAGALGKDADIARVKVDLPKQLPSYLPTLQKACLAATFAVNPAACPAGSVVGIAKTHTPLLANELSGPVYFVSHGGEDFPSLVIVLQGDGVRVDLIGSTLITKGITSSTFKTVPDVPVDTFELYLPQGPAHALAANGNLCSVKGGLKMPTTLVAQNGMQIEQSTKIGVAGCPKGKVSRRHKAK